MVEEGRFQSSSEKRLVQARSRKVQFEMVVLFLITVVFALHSVLFFGFADIRAVVNRVPDDSAYFFKIAQNVVAGKGPTFDGMNKTNGFQPLWLCFLLPLAWVMRGSPPELFARACLLYQALLIIIAAWIFYAQVASYTDRRIALVSTAIFYSLGLGRFLNGMETGLLILTLLMLALFSVRRQVFLTERSWDAFGFGLLLGLVLLARLDMIFLALVIYTFLIGRFLFSRVNRRQQLWQLMFAMAGTGLLLFPYLMYNRLEFGSAMPISGQLKNSFPQVEHIEFGPPRVPLQVVGVVGIGLFWLGWQGMRYWRNRAKNAGIPSYRAGLIFLGVAMLLHYLHTALFMKWAVFLWHFAFYFLLFCLIVPDMLNLVFGRLSKPFSWGLALGVIVVALGSAIQRHRYHAYSYLRSPPEGWQVASYEAAVWVRTHTPPNTVLAMSDTGILGFYSQRPVINLDGIVNNLEYQQALRAKRLNKYLRKYRVQYLVHHAFWNEEELISGRYESCQFRYRSHLYGTESEPVIVYQWREVYRSGVYLDGPYKTVLVIWRL